MNKIFNVNIRYLQEFAPLGTAGGIYHFRDQIRAGNPDAFFVMNGDVCADFPLEEMLVFHQGKENAMATILWYFTVLLVGTHLSVTGAEWKEPLMIQIQINLLQKWRIIHFSMSAGS